MSHNVRRVMEGCGDEEASMHPTSRRHDANATNNVARGVRGCALTPSARKSDSEDRVESIPAWPVLVGVTLNIVA